MASPIFFSRIIPRIFLYHCSSHTTLLDVVMALDYRCCDGACMVVVALGWLVVVMVHGDGGAWLVVMS